jgi:uncharacterized protein
LRKQKWQKKYLKFPSLFIKPFLYLLPICIFAYAYFIEPNWIDINPLVINLPHLAPEFDGYRIVQISDIHTDRWMTQEHLNRIFQLVNQQKPDLVAITGDFVTRNCQRFIPNLRATIGQLTPKDVTVSVWGNHDYWANPQAIAQALQENGVVNLQNGIYTLQRGNNRLYIVGVDDALEGKPRLDLLLNALPQEGAAILLAHEPDFADTSAPTKRFDLQLSGHSHAGQIRLPFIRPLALPTLGQKYYAGLYQIRGMELYTNRGIGVTGLHLRFNSRPEITVITLVAGGK